jgi:hypothetical protein
MPLPICPAPMTPIFSIFIPTLPIFRTFYFALQMRHKG